MCSLYNDKIGTEKKRKKYTLNYYSRLTTRDIFWRKKTAKNYNIISFRFVGQWESNSTGNLNTAYSCRLYATLVHGDWYLFYYDAQKRSPSHYNKFRDCSGDLIFSTNNSNVLAVFCALVARIGVAKS